VPRRTEKRILGVKTQPPAEFLERLQALGLLNAEQRQQVEAQLEEEPSLFVSEAVQSVAGLDQNAFLKLLCEEFGSEYVDPQTLFNWPVQDAALEVVDDKVAHDHAVFPLHYDAEKSRLLLVTAYPFSPHALSDLEQILSDIELELTFCDEGTLQELLRRGYIGSEPLLEIADEEGDGFEIGAASDEEAFPGLYGDNVADYLYGMGDASGGEGEGDGVDEMQGGVRGSLSDLGVVDMLQALGQGRKTCSLFIETDADEHAAVYLQDGIVIHAQSGDVSGEEAVFRALGWTKGHFEILQRPYSGEPTMAAGVEGLLLEGMRRLDEANR